MKKQVEVGPADEAQAQGMPVTGDMTPASEPTKPGSPADGRSARPRDIKEIFLVFNRLTLLGFGGVLPMTQRTLVEDKRWITPDEFVEMLSLSQVLPGPNIINLSLMVGQRFFGWRGACAALAGMLAAPLLIILIVGAAYSTFAHNPAAARALHGMSVVAAGLIIGVCLKLSLTLRNQSWAWAWAFAAFAGVALARFNLLWVLLVLGPPAVALHWMHHRRETAR